MAQQRTSVAIVGAGASGVTTALALLEHWGGGPGELTIKLIDPAASTGRGPAYSTSDPRHLLNVPAGRMSAYAEDPGHFTRWLASTRGVHDPAAFVPRAWFGDYLEDSLEATTASSGVLVERCQDQVLRLQRRGQGYRLELADGGELEASHVVLALGGTIGQAASLPGELLASPRFVANPWAPGALDGLRSTSGDVLLLGTGLTAVDVALSLAGPSRTLTAVSRRGILPRSHASQLASKLRTPELPPGPLSLAEAEALVAAQVAEAKLAGAPWQHGVDSLRPITNELWQRLGDTDRRAFIEGPMRTWEVARHRMAPEVAARFGHLRCSGQLLAQAGTVVAAAEREGGIEVELSDGSRRCFEAVINCTGPGGLRSSTGPIAELVDSLEREGLASIHELGLGLEVDGQGRAIGASGGTAQSIYVVGPLRRGRLWETTAIPEIVQQAQQVATDLVETNSRPRRRSCIPRDLSGPSRAGSRPAVDCYHEALACLRLFEPGLPLGPERSAKRCVAEPVVGVANPAQGYDPPRAASSSGRAGDF